MLSKFGNHRKELRPLAIDECAEQQMLQQNNKNISTDAVHPFTPKILFPKSIAQNKNP